MNEQKTSLRRYALASCVLFILMNLYPLLALINGINLSIGNYFYSFLSLGFLAFSIIFMKTYFYHEKLILELQKYKIKTNSVAAKRLSSIISKEKEEEIKIKQDINKDFAQAV